MSAVPRTENLPTTPPARKSIVDQQLIECRREFLGFFRRRLASPADAEDTLQDFYLKVIQAASTLQDSEKIDAWLGSILRNTLTDHYRRRAARQRAQAAFRLEPLELAVTPEVDSDRTPCHCVHDLLPKLKPEYTEIIRLADLDETPRDQVANKLALTANNVGVRLHRARRALRLKLKEECAGCRDGGFQTCGCLEKRRSDAA